MFFDFINEVMAKFVFWKPLKTLGILLEVSDPHVARTPNLQKTVCFGCVLNTFPLLFAIFDDTNTINLTIFFVIINLMGVFFSSSSLSLDNVVVVVIAVVVMEIVFVDVVIDEVTIVSDSFL